MPLLEVEDQVECLALDVVVVAVGRGQGCQRVDTAKNGVEAQLRLLGGDVGVFLTEGLAVNLGEINKPGPLPTQLLEPLCRELCREDSTGMPSSSAAAFEKPRSTVILSRMRISAPSFCAAAFSRVSAVWTNMIMAMSPSTSSSSSSKSASSSSGPGALNWKHRG